MKRTVCVAAAQYPISFHAHKDDWAAHTGQWVSDAVAQGAELLLFPEYAAMELVSLMPVAAQRDLQQQIRLMDGFKADFLDVFTHWARHFGVHIVPPTFPVLEGGICYNRCFVCSPAGLVGHQDKWFMTLFEAEEWFVSAGQRKVTVFEADWGKFGIQTCYDVEFPVGAALLCRQGADLILAPSCTETAQGAARVHVGARARALENQCYVAVSQVVGDALWSLAVDINYGYSAFYATPDKGFTADGVLSQQPPQSPGWLLQNLDFSLLDVVRKEGAVLNARDHLQIRYT
jgi:predicted amidohydrolase